MNQIDAPKPSGNRCGHDPKNPQLSPPEPIRTGPGGLPRILSLAAERLKEWFWNPKKCPELQSNPDRQTRSERRKAIQVVLEFLLSRLSLATLCVGVPTPCGFIDVDMKTIVAGTALGKRRCERAIAQLKTAGFMTVNQPRHRNEEGKYVGLRAVRVITRKLFEWLNLGPMLDRERRRSSKSLSARAIDSGKSVADLVRRKAKSLGQKFRLDSRPGKRRELDREIKTAWNRMAADLMIAGADHDEARNRVNQHFGFPQNWSPGMGVPEEA